MTHSSSDFQIIRHLQIKAMRRVEGVFAGIYRSTFKGQGLEFETVREYQEGDDIRTIDWNVTARSRIPYIKIFKEERELTVLLMVDLSSSNQYGHTPHFKSEKIAEIGALLAFSAIKNQDKVGLILFTSEIELYLRPQKNIRHVLRVIRELLFFKPKHMGTDLKKALTFVGKIHKKHAICFLISDFDAPNFQLEATLLAKRHELIGIRVNDHYEQVFPNMGLINLQDLETNQQRIVNTADKNVREKFEKKAKQNQLLIKQLFEKIGASFISIQTDEPADEILYHFFKRRIKK